MRKYGIKIISLLFILSFFLNGCASMLPISDSDEEKISVYTAGLISRFNQNQRRGIVPVAMNKEEEEVADEEMDEESEEFKPLDPYNVNTPTSDGGESNLTTVLGIDGVSVKYKGMKVLQSYGENSGFVINPQNGNSFVAVTYTFTNTTEAQVNANVRDNALAFTGKLSEVVSAADRTILPDDLCTFNGTIAAGESIDLSILFQFPTEIISDLSGLEVACIKNGVRYQVPF